MSFDPCREMARVLLRQADPEEVEAWGLDLDSFERQGAAIVAGLEDQGVVLVTRRELDLLRAAKEERNG